MVSDGMARNIAIKYGLGTAKRGFAKKRLELLSEVFMADGGITHCCLYNMGKCDKLETCERIDERNRLVDSIKEICNPIKTH